MGAKSTDLKSELYRALAEYIADLGIKTSVISGVTPFSGEIGRDLDLYIPRLRDGQPLHAFFADKLHEYGVRWVLQPRLYHGTVTIGIPADLSTYIELHTISDLRWRTFQLDHHVPLAPQPMAYGLPFDLRYYSFRKVIMRHSRPFLAAQRPDVPEDDLKAFACWHDHHEYRAHPLLRHVHEVARTLSEDKPDERRRLAIQKELRELLRASITHAPVSAAGAMLLVAYQRVGVYLNKMTPIFVINSPLEADELQRTLEEHFSNVFLDVCVFSSFPTFVRMRWLVGGLRLVIVTDPEDRAWLWTPDACIDWPASCDKESLDATISIGHEIMYAWSRLYGVTENV